MQNPSNPAIPDTQPHSIADTQPVKPILIPPLSSPEPRTRLRRGGLLRRSAWIILAFFLLVIPSTIGGLTGYFSGQAYIENIPSNKSVILSAPGE